MPIIFPFFPISADKAPPGFPIITQSPNTKVIEIGHTAVMQCRATGNPKPKIHWIKDMKRVDINNQRYSLIDGEYKWPLFPLPDSLISN